MPSVYCRHKEIALFAGAATLLFGFGGLACADVKIVTTVNVTGTLPQFLFGRRLKSADPDSSAENGASSGTYQPHFPLTVTTCYKGKMARIEITDGPTFIYDGAANKVYVLHPDQKTYSPISPQQMFAQENGLPGALPAPIHFDTGLNLQKSDATATFLGQEAARYDLTATLTASRPSGGFNRGGFRRRRFPGGGGFPGGFSGGMPLQEGDGFQGGDGGTMRPRRTPPSIHIDGEYWLADGSVLPQENREAVLLLLQQTLMPGDPILDSLHTKLTKLKLMPLSSKVTMQIADPRSGSTDSVVTTMEVKSIHAEALDDQLFHVPADYTRVTPPAANHRQSLVSRAGIRS